MSLACAALAEAVLLAVVVLIVGHGAPPPPPAERTPLRIAIQAPPAPPRPVPPPPPPPPAAPRVPLPAPPPPRPVPEVRPLPAPQHEPAHPSHRMRHRPPPPVEQPVQAAQPIREPAPAPAPRPAPQAPSQPSPGETATFQAMVRQAVQTALIFPRAAQAAHQQGVAHVRFTYTDGTISGARISRSSGYPLLDSAALQTVRSAHYPPTPAHFAGRTLQMDVDVIFQGGDDTDSPD